MANYIDVGIDGHTGGNDIRTARWSAKDANGRNLRWGDHASLRREGAYVLSNSHSA